LPDAALVRGTPLEIAAHREDAEHPDLRTIEHVDAARPPGPRRLTAWQCRDNFQSSWAASGLEMVSPTAGECAV
jgi:hypothetical protein